MTPFALDIIVRASALLAAATAADFAMRNRASAAARHLVWTLAIGALGVVAGVAGGARAEGARAACRRAGARCRAPGWMPWRPGRAW